MELFREVAPASTLGDPMEILAPLLGKVEMFIIVRAQPCQRISECDPPLSGACLDVLRVRSGVSRSW